MDNAPKIAFDNVTMHYHYAPFPVCTDLSFAIPAGGTTTLLIDKQSGKSTICKLILGLEKPNRGTILVDGVDVAKTKGKEKNIAYLPASLLLFERKTVAYNVGYPLKVRGVDKEEIAARVAEVLKKFGLTDRQNVKVKKLNFEGKIDVVLARIALRKPDIVLCDGIGDVVSDVWFKRINSTLREVGATAVHLTSKFDAADGNILLFHQGKLIAQGDKEYIKTEHAKLLWLDNSNAATTH
jgi:ABC-type multidrug transport system ATPase subunit